MILAMAGFAFEDLFIKILSAHLPISEIIIILGFTGSVRISYYCNYSESSQLFTKMH